MTRFNSTRLFAAALFSIFVLAQISAAVAQTGAQNEAKPEPILDPASITAQPEYPEVSRLLDEQGNSQLLISVSADGKVTDVKVTKSSGHDALDEAAIEHVKKNWKFSPAKQNGRAVASSMEVLMEWKLEGAAAPKSATGAASKTFAAKDDKEEKEIFDRLRYASGKVYGSLSLADKISRDRYESLLTALHISNWQPKYWGVDSYWFQLTRIYLEKGEIEKARSVAARIAYPPTLIGMKADKFFDPVTHAAPDQFNMDKAAARFIAIGQKRLANYPDRIAVINRLADGYMIANRPQEALTLLDKTLAEVNINDLKSSRFKDAYEVNWIMQSRAEALYYLNRKEEAFQQMEVAARQKETAEGWRDTKREHRNVSQVLNFAIFLVERGEAEKARALLAQYPGSWTSDYGVMVSRSVRACVFSQIPFPEKTDALDYLRRHVLDGPFLYMRGLLCMEEMDKAAALYIDLLTPEKNIPKSISWRSTALYNCQRGRDTQNVQDGIGDKAWTELCDRPDVIAAINSNGRIESYPKLNLDGGF